jgi:hypothetical protein
MKRTLVITALALTTTLGGCAVTPVGYYGPPRAVVVEAPTIYPPQYQYRPMYRNDYNGYREQRRWNSWYQCQRYYGNSARCAY